MTTILSPNLPPLKCRIALAVAQGHRSTRGIAVKSGASLGSVYRHLIILDCEQIVTWEMSKSRTLRPGPLAAVVRGPDGQIKEVMRVDPDFRENIAEVCNGYHRQVEGWLQRGLVTPGEAAELRRRELEDD